MGKQDNGGFQAPPESYSRQIDNRVAAEEMPYGYESSPPPADTGNYNQAALESRVAYRRKGGRAV